MSTAENAPALIRPAGGLFRTKGIDGVGVADICKAAGLTHGALYGQFGSKQALVAEALAQHSFYPDRPQKHSAARKQKAFDSQKRGDQLRDEFRRSPTANGATSFARRRYCRASNHRTDVRPTSKEQMKARDQAPRPINENAHSRGWTGGAVEAVVAGRAGAAA